MSSSAAPRCRHIKVNGTQCGSPALRHTNFCFYHQQDRPLTVECYSEGPYATGEIALPLFEDAHSIQTVIRQVVQMVLQKRLERKTASLLLYAPRSPLRISSVWNSKSRNQSRLSSMSKRNRKLPWLPILTTKPPAKARQTRNRNGTLVQSKLQPKPTKTMTLSAATKTFPPERSRPAIGLDRSS